MFVPNIRFLLMEAVFISEIFCALRGYRYYLGRTFDKESPGDTIYDDDVEIIDKNQNMTSSEIKAYYEGDILSHWRENMQHWSVLPIVDNSMRKMSGEPVTIVEATTTPDQTLRLNHSFQLIKRYDGTISDDYPKETIKKREGVFTPPLEDVTTNSEMGKMKATVQQMQNDIQLILAEMKMIRKILGLYSRKARSNKITKFSRQENLQYGTDNGNQNRISERSRWGPYEKNRYGSWTIGKVPTYRFARNSRINAVNVRPLPLEYSLHDPVNERN